MKQKKMLALLTLVACFQIHTNSLNADDGAGAAIAAKNMSKSGHDSWGDHNDMSGPHKKLDVKGHNDDNDMWNFGVWGMFTYWNMTGGGAIVSEVETSSTRQAILFPNDYTRPGFKVGVELTIPPGMVDVDVDFTWFYNEHKKNSFGTRTLTGTDTWANDFQTAGGSFANSFYRIDFTLDKELMFGDHFGLAPGGGLIGMWGKTWFNSQFSDHLTVTGTSTVANNQTYWGVGPYADICAEFFADMFSMMDNARWVFYMKAGTGFAWTNNKANFDIVNTLNVTTPEPVLASGKATWVQNVIDGSLGIKWEMMPSSDNSFGTWGLNLAWDYQWWPNLLIGEIQNSSVDLLLHGLTTGLEVKW